eukprot:SAG31_NODE_687_length_12813_cov_2.597216_7_plen_708_part_00
MKNTIFDGHGVLLGYLQLVPLLYQHGHLLSPELIKLLRPKIMLGLRASFAQGSSDLWYTNILIGRITNNILLGTWLNDSSVVAEGEQLLDHWLNYTHDNNGVLIHEYASTFYFWNDLNALMPASQYYRTSSSRPTNRLLAVTDQLFAHLSAGYFPPTRTMTGPHSRDYAFLDGKFYIVRGVWGAGIMGITMAFLDPDAHSVTAAHLSDLQNAVLYHALITEGGYRPPCALVDLAAGDNTSSVIRHVRSRQGPSNITGDRTVAMLLSSSSSYAVGSMSEDFEAIDCPAESCYAWCPESKELNIELSPASNWSISTEVWPSITTVVDEHDAPWGLIRRVANWSKPTHLRARLGSVQHTPQNSQSTVLLTTLDIDASQLSPPGSDRSDDLAASIVPAAQSPPLLCNVSRSVQQARHGFGWQGNFVMVGKYTMHRTTMTKALDKCATSCCTVSNCTGWAVKPSGVQLECVLVSKGEQTYPNAAEYSGTKGPSLPPPPPSPPPATLRTSLATNVVFPARVEQVVFSGETVIFPNSTDESGYVLEGGTATNATLLLAQRGTCFAVRIVRADSRREQQKPVEVELKADRASLQLNAARLAIYHYRGQKRALQGSVKVGLVMVTGPCQDPTKFAAAVRRMTVSSVYTGVSPATGAARGTWTSSVEWQEELLGVGKLEVVRDSAKVRSRKINDVDVAMPEEELVVNGKPLSFLGRD